MSKILEVAKHFEQTSKEQAANTEQVVSNEFQRMNEFIANALKQSQQQIESDINAQNRTIKGLLLKSWLWAILAILTLILALWGVIAYQSHQISQKQAILNQMQSNGFQIIDTPQYGRILILPKGAQAGTYKGKTAYQIKD